MSYGDDMDSSDILKSSYKPFSGYIFSSSGVADKVC